jgi:type II secretory pathway pseudopilin PulG
MNRRGGFTLFELILAIGLSAVLLALIGTAINLYLTRVDASRARVEEAQLARTVLAMIADDIRGASVYQPQDTSAIAQIMAKTQLFNVDDIDKLKSQATSGGSSSSGSSSGSSIGGSSGTSGSSLSTSGLTASSQSSSGGSSNGQPDDNTLPLGVSGSAEEIYVDATRLPNHEEIFRTLTGYSNAQSPNAGGATTSASGATSAANAPPATDLNTVHYFVRPGDALDPGNAAATSLDPESQQRLGGLVRQEVPRAARHFAEQNGSGDVVDSNQVLIAPEVVRIEFKYFNGSEVFTEWDMKEQQLLPMAVEVCIWLRTPGSANQPITTQTSSAGLSNNARQYRQVVYLPMAQVMAAAQSGSSGDSSMTDSSGNSSADSSSNGASGTESSFNQTE